VVLGAGRAMWRCKRICTLPTLEPRPLGHPTRRQSLLDSSLNEIAQAFMKEAYDTASLLENPCTDFASTRLGRMDTNIDEVWCQVLSWGSSAEDRAQ
jgi:hypothetical protein